jgi:hypothetical protein
MESVMPTKKHPGWHQGEKLTGQVREQEKDGPETTCRQPQDAKATPRKEIQEHDQASRERNSIVLRLLLVHVSKVEPMSLEVEAT